MRTGLWIILSILLLPLVLAQAPSQSFKINIEPTEQSILLNQTATFSLTVQNDLTQTEQFKLYSPDVEWDVQFVPASDRILSVAPGLSKTVIVNVRPLYVNPGLFGVTINIKSTRSDELRKAVLFVSVSSQEQVEAYLPSIYSEVKAPATIDPREPGMITLHLENRNRKTLPNIDVKMRSNLLQHDEILSLTPLEKKDVTFPFEIPPTTEPQEDTIQATLIYKEDGKTYHFDARPLTFTIQNYGGIEEKKEIKKSFFKYTDTVIFNNNGNARKSYVYNVPTSFLKNIFTSTDPIGGVYEKKGDQPIIKFVLLLEPGEQKTVIVIKNYRPLVWTFLIILVLILLYQYYKSPVVLTKTSKVITTQEGGASEIKVVVTVRNRGPKPMQDVLIMDKIPNIAQIIREFDVGTLQPTHILKNEQKGTLIKWTLDRLEKFEERLISYRIKTRLAVLGTMQLPPAVAKYRTVQGKEKIVTSKVKFEEN